MLAPVLLFSDGLDPSTRSWVSAVYAAGGIVSFPRRRIVDKFVRAAKSSGSWALTDDYWGLWGENVIQSLMSLKQRRLATTVNSPTFTADRGYVFDGATNYINTNFIPSTHGVQLTGTDQRISIYERTDLDAAAYSAGVFVGATSRIDITTRGGTSLTGRLNSGGGNFTNANSLGLHAVSRAGGATTMKGYKNGVALTDVTGLTVGTGKPNIAIFIGCLDLSGNPSTFRASSVGFLSVGAPLSSAQELSQYKAVQAWATAVGAQV